MAIKIGNLICSVMVEHDSANAGVPNELISPAAFPVPAGEDLSMVTEAMYAATADPDKSAPPGRPGPLSNGGDNASANGRVLVDEMTERVYRIMRDEMSIDRERQGLR